MRKKRSEASGGRVWGRDAAWGVGVRLEVNVCAGLGSRSFRAALSQSLPMVLLLPRCGCRSAGRTVWCSALTR